MDPKYAGVLALLVATLGFHLCMPFSGPDPRYLVTALPMTLILSCCGLYRVAALFRKREPVAVALALVVVLVSSATGVFAITRRPRLGFAEVADYLVRSDPGRRRVALVCSDANGEGAFIEEVGLREARPGHIVLRASKYLSDNHWIEPHYRARFADLQQILDFVNTIPVDFVVIDESRPMWREDMLRLRDAMELAGSAWKPVPNLSSGERKLDVYERRNLAAGGRARQFAVPLTHTLGRSVQGSL